MRSALRWTCTVAALVMAAVCLHVSVSGVSNETVRRVTENHALPPTHIQPHEIAVSVTPTIAPATALKYRYLLSDLPAGAPNADRVRELLQRREDAVDQRVSTDRVSTLEAALLAVLPPVQHETYRLLRDSDAEQQALNEFAGGIAATSPLSDAQQRELLLAKLRHKQQLQTWLEHSGSDRPQLSPEERDYAHRTLERALEDSRDAYLQEMRAMLDDTQYTQLSDYERTEFAVALQRSQQSINER